MENVDKLIRAKKHIEYLRKSSNMKNVTKSYTVMNNINEVNSMETLPIAKGEKHLDICKQLNETFWKKNQDYGDSFAELFAEYGEISAAIRLEDKLKRFKQLIRNPAQVKDESKIDTLLDMANYAIMTVIEMEDKNNEQIRF